jgi:hypothetical protein
VPDLPLAMRALLVQQLGRALASRWTGLRQATAANETPARAARDAEAQALAQRVRHEAGR